MKYNAKVIFLKEELMKVEDDLTSLENHMTGLGRLIWEARAWISQWRTEEHEKVMKHHSSKLRNRYTRYFLAIIYT